MPDEIERKDIANKLDGLTIKVAEGFAENKVLIASIVNQLTALNGKVAKHEEALNKININDAVEREMLKRVDERQRTTVEDGKRFSSMIKGNFWGVFFNILGMGLVALITFYFANK